MNKGCEIMKWREKTIIVSVLFYAVMLFLTLIARPVHNVALPKVTIGRLEGQRFQRNETNDQTDTVAIGDFAIGIPKNLYENGSVYILSKEIMNGEERDIAREVKNMEIGRFNENYYEIIKGISGLDLVILTGGEFIEDGQEVYVENR